MIDQDFLSVTDLPELSLHRLPLHRGEEFGPLQSGERVLWQGRAGIAEYAFEKPASLPKWTLPETTALMVTDQRVRYAHTVSDSDVISGELRWLWPQHLRVQPGARESGRSAAATQIQLVCGGADGSWPALVFAGGDLRTAADADRLANLLRQAIARFRMDNTTELGLTIAQSRLLSRLLIGPEFSNYQGGPGETVSIPGALLITRSLTETLDPPAAAYQPAATQPPAPTPPPAALDEPILKVVAQIELPVAGSPPPDPSPTRRIFPLPDRQEPRTVPAAEAPGRHSVDAAPPAVRPLIGEGATRVISVRPGIAADMARALQAAKAEAATQESEPDLASRAADLAARVASLVSGATENAAAESYPATDRNADEGIPAAGGREPATVRVDLSARAESIRRTAARFAGNSARMKNQPRDVGAISRGNRTL